VAGVAVLARQPNLAAVEEVEAPGVGPIAEAQQHARGDPVGKQPTPPDGQWGDTDSTSDEDRAGRALGHVGGRGERSPQRPVEPQSLTRLQLRETRGAGAYGLHEEVEPDAAALALRVGDREGAREVRAALIATPAGVRGEHVELARGGLRARLVERREDPVTARLQVPGHLAEAAAEGCDRSLSEPARPACGHLCDG
jgi:hypothetical protein